MQLKAHICCLTFVFALAIQGCAISSPKHQIIKTQTLTAATCLTSTRYIVDHKNNASLRAELKSQKANLQQIEPDQRKRKAALQIANQGFSQKSLNKIAQSHPAYQTMSMDDLGIVVAQLGRMQCTPSKVAIKNLH